MENSIFREYTTSTAFSLQLSKMQCNTLLRVARVQADLKHIDVAVVTVMSLNPLAARGLVYWHKDENGRSNGFRGLTEAGKLVVGLLQQAGLTVENTNTLSVLKRVERELA